MFMKYFQSVCQDPPKLRRHPINRQPCLLPVEQDLLESLRCHRTDEYPVISCDDEVPVPPLACSFSRAQNTAHILALVDENGCVVIYNTNKAGDDAIVTDWTAHSNAIFDLKWMCREEKVLTASGDQTVCLWDVKTKAKQLTFKGHTSSVRSVGFRPDDDAVFASGSRDGHVRIWDVRCNVKESKVSSVSTIRNAHTVPLQLNARRKKSRQGLIQPQDSQQSVTCVVFQDDNLLATGGAVDGCVKVWDIRKLKLDTASTVYQFPYSGVSKRTHGFSSLTFDKYLSRLFASCTDDVIYCYDFISYNQQPVSTYKGHRNTSFYVKAVVSPDNKFLLSGSSDEHAYIWQVDKPNASPVTLKGHRSEISDVAWCSTDLFRLVTTSDDNTMRVWRLDPTVRIRKQQGQTDRMYDITGYAELTHRDIGVSAESNVKPAAQSPVPGMKRSATYPLSAAVELTPKRSKISTSASPSPSPSIKMWLKRSASDTGNIGSTSVTGPKQIKLTGEITGNKTNGKGISNKEETHVSDKAKCDSTGTCVGNTEKGPMNQNDSKVIRKPCKRKLEICENESVKRKKIDTENSSVSVKDENGNKLDLEDHQCANSEKGNSAGASIINQTASPNKESNVSPAKHENALQDLSSAINSSPVKGEIPRREFSSPAPVRVLDLASKSHLASPTANLPNFVVDGPQFFQNSTPQKQTEKKKTIDWLTQMRKQKVAGCSPKSKAARSKFLDKLDQVIEEETPLSQETEKPSTPKLKSPVRGFKPITSFFHRQQCET